MSVSVSKDITSEILARVQELTSKRVLVGIPEDASARPDGEVGNALIGYVQENGCPELNIPARPFLVPGVASVQDKAVRRLESAGKAALEGNAAGAMNQLNAIGLEASAAVKDKMDTGPFTPLADSTLRGRVRRRGGSQVGAKEELESRAAGNPPGTDLAQPLIDTGDLQNHITYVVRDMKG